MRIEIWSDVVCPWCYIGKRRLERALADFAHAEDVEVVWRSYQLDPAAPSGPALQNGGAPVESVAEMLGRKYGGGVEAGRSMIDQVEAAAAEEGLLFRLHDAVRVGTLDAHRLLHLASESGGSALQGRLKEVLLDAYFVRALNLGDHAELTRLATGVGLEESQVMEVLSGTRYADRVEQDAREAAALGATGVPFYVVDRRYGISGAQPVEAFAEVLARAWSDAHPLIDLIASGADAGVCGPQGCAVDGPGGPRPA